MNNSTSPSACASNNPDISGVGVRVSFYLQTFLLGKSALYSPITRDDDHDGHVLVLLVDRSSQDAPSALWTFISTSFGLTVAAIVQAGAGSLTFFQAVQVSNLVWCVRRGRILLPPPYSSAL